jgi:hypothetical protein
MQRVPVESSCLSTVAYEPTTETLEIEFRHGGVYRYEDVPKKVFRGLLRSKSAGRYYNRRVKGIGYPCWRRLTA